MEPSGQTFTGDDDEDYVAYCPGGAGVTYYLLACLGDTGFLGCCSSQDGCYDGCQNSNYSNLTFSSLYNSVPQSFQSNIQNQLCDFQSVWYSCPEKYVNTNFIGCCTTDPCDSGCPADHYARAFLKTGTDAANFFNSLNASSMSFSVPSTTLSTSTGSSSSTMVTSSSSVASSSATTTSNSASAYPTETAASQILQTASTPGTSVVVGSTVGGVAALILIVGLVAYRVRRKAASRRSHLADFRASSSVWGGGGGGGGGGEGKAESGSDSNAAAVEVPSLKQPQEPSELTVLPPPSAPKLSTSTYTAYSRPFSELDASFITPRHPSSSPARAAPSPPASRGGSVAGAHVTHPYPIPGAYSDGVGQAQ